MYASPGLTNEYTREECTIERKLLYELNWPAWWHLDTLYYTYYLKLVSTIFYQIFIFSPNYSPSRTIKNSFYFTDNPLFLLKLGQITVFLTHINIRQMPTWLPLWKAKWFYCVGYFLPTWLFLPLRKFRTIKIKLEKSPYTQINASLLHISRNFEDIFKYICFTLYLPQAVNNWESAIIFIDRCCLPCFFFFQEILDPISLE